MTETKTQLNTRVRAQIHEALKDEAKKQKRTITVVLETILEDALVRTNDRTARKAKSRVHKRAGTEVADVRG